MVRHQQREILCVGPAGHRHRPRPEVLHAVQPRRVPVREGRDDDIRATGQRLVGHLGGIPDDQVGSVPDRDQRVRAGSDADQPRLLLPNEPAESGQVRDVVVAGRHHEHPATVQIDLDRRNPEPVEQQRALAAHELDGVGGERLELVGQPGLGFDERVRDRLRRLGDALAQHLLPRVDAPVCQANLAPVPYRMQDA